jgi:hypothetical protein
MNAEGLLSCEVLSFAKLAIDARKKNGRAIRYDFYRIVTTILDSGDRPPWG